MGLGYRNQSVYIVHPMGKNRFTETLTLCQKIQQSMRCPIILKKIDQELYAYLRSSEFFQKQQDVSISHAETLLKYPETARLLEEEAFPEHILHLSALYGSTASGYNKNGSFIRKVKRFEKNTITLLSERTCVHVEEMPGFSTLLVPNSEKYQSYIQMIREVGTHDVGDGRYKVSTYYDEQQTLHGLYISESFGNGTMGLYCAVSSKGFPGITEWMDYHFFQRLYQDGIQYLYLGGSETQGVDTYIKKLFPISPPYLLQPMQITGRDELSPEIDATSAG